MISMTMINKQLGGLSWWFAQNVYCVKDICRAVKSGEGSGNIPKVIIEYEI